MSDLTWDDYQLATAGVAIYPEANEGTERALTYVTLGLTNEAGEVAGKFKKVIRDDNGEMSDEKIAGVVAEIGDVLWYASQLANELGVSLEAIAQANVDKLLGRKERGTIGGSGDNR